MQDRIEELERQIEKLKAKQETAKSWGVLVRTLDSFTTEDKVKVFDALYKQAHEYLTNYAKDGYAPKDGDAYLYEAVLTKMLGPRVWEVIRSLG